MHTSMLQYMQCINKMLKITFLFLYSTLYIPFSRDMRWRCCDTPTSIRRRNDNFDTSCRGSHSNKCAAACVVAAASGTVTRTLF